MTIFRVNEDRDLPMVVKRIKDPALEKASKIFFKDLGEIRKKLLDVEMKGSKAMKKSREVYTLCDKALKKKGLGREDKADLVRLRKMSYDFTNELKRLGIK